MTRVTKEWLASRVKVLNELLGRPTTLWNKDAAAGDQNIGHLLFDKDIGGYKLVEIVGSGGLECSWSTRLSQKDMDLYIDGLMNGVSLRIAQEEQQQLAKQLEQAGITPDAAIYGTANTALLHSTKDGV